jgi:hypothetical protein
MRQTKTSYGSCAANDNNNVIVLLEENAVSILILTANTLYDNKGQYTIRNTIYVCPPKL